MNDKIQVAAPLVVLHGDEMAQVAFERILELFVHQRLEIPLVEFDLSAENRLVTNGAVVRDAIEALKAHGVGIKNAGMTVNRAQLNELLAPDHRTQLSSHLKNLIDERARDYVARAHGTVARSGVDGRLKDQIASSNIRRAICNPRRRLVALLA